MRITPSSSLADLIVAYLKAHPDKRFHAREIAEHIFTTYPDRMVKKRSTSLQKLETDAQLIRQLYDEIHSRATQLSKRSKHFIYHTETSPRLFYYAPDEKDTVPVPIVPVDKKTSTADSVLEASLYKPVCTYLMAEHNVYAKRIDEKTSKNTHGMGYNSWLHPDICGIEPMMPPLEFHKSVVDVATHFYTQKARLWSLEIKISLTKSNVREYFFQTVANSSWANFAYLVAPNIRTAKDASVIINELTILSNLYGVGVIELNSDDPVESTLLLRAKERTTIDWNIVDRLCKENKDFAEYIKRINIFYKTSELEYRDWDF